MAATKADILEWLEQGKAQGAAYMLVICDSFDYEDYPVYAATQEEAASKGEHYSAAPMQRVMECYDLNMDWYTQLSEARAWHGWRNVHA